MGLPYASNLQHSDHVMQQHQQTPHSKYTSEDESSSVTGSGSGANQHPNFSTNANITCQINSGESSTSPSKRTYHKTNTLNSTQNSIISQTGVATSSNLIPTNLFDPNNFARKEDFDELSNQLKEKREEHDILSKELEKLKDQYQNELSNFHQSLTEERERHDVRMSGFFSFIY